MRAFRLAYDGTPFYGFQRQPDVPTVEDALFDALRELGVLGGDEPKPTGYAAAGRTDAGVSALAQTVAFEVPEWLTPRALNAELPASVRSWAAAEAPADFHATFDATERRYEYHLYAPPGTGANGENADPGERSEPAADGSHDAFDDERAAGALAALSGTHDVANLTPDDEHTERTLTLGGSREGPFYRIDVRAGGFSRELVRRLVSVVREVGTGEAGLDRVERVLDPEPLPGHVGVAPAPAEPLILVDVDYPDLDFEADERAAASAREIFDRRRVERLTGARVAGRIADGVGSE